MDTVDGARGPLSVRTHFLFLAMGLLSFHVSASAMPMKLAPPLPPPTGNIINVSTVAELRSAIGTAPTGSTILVADGTYNVVPRIVMRQNGITIRGASGDPTKVILRGQGWASMDSNDTIILMADSNRNITIAHMTFTDCYQYGIHLQGEHFPENIHIYNCHFRDIGVRMIKGSGSSGKAEGGSIRFCHFENTKIPPTTWQQGGTYITSIDMMALHDWEISDNSFLNIRGAWNVDQTARPAIFVWKYCKNLLITRNVIVNCDRGIGLGNPGGGDVTGPNVSDSLVSNNFIKPYNDAAIELWYVDNIDIIHNTIYSSYRALRGNLNSELPVLRTRVTNNIIKGQIELPGADVTYTNNYQGTTTGYFENLSQSNYRLTADAVNVINMGSPIAAVTVDFDNLPRDSQPDLGASEYRTGPVASAGEDMTVYTGELVTLNGTGSVGQDGMTFAWTRDGGSGPSVTLTGANTATPRFTVASAGTYIFRLTITDSRGSDYDTVTVTVGSVLAAAGADREVNPGETVQLDGTHSRGNITSYQWTHEGGTNPGTISNANTSSATFTAGAAGQTHSIRLTVSGPSGSDTDTVTFDVITPPVETELVNSSHLEVRGVYADGIWSDAGSYATNTTARTLGYNNDDEYRDLLLMRFSTDSIPSSATIKSAKLRIYCHSDYDPRGAMVRAFGLNQAWTSSATYLTRDGSNAWSGGRIVTSMDADWADQQINNATTIDSNDTPNPDYTNAAYPDGDNWTDRWIEFDVTGVVADWIDGSRTNHGLVLASTNYSQAGGAKVNWGYTTMQWRTSAHATDKPRLKVFYQTTMPTEISFNARDPVNFSAVTPESGGNGTSFSASATQSQPLMAATLGMGAIDPGMGSLTLTITETGGTYNGSIKPIFPSPVSDAGSGSAITKLSSTAAMSGDFDGHGTIIYSLTLTGASSSASATLTLTVAPSGPTVVTPAVTAGAASSIAATSARANGNVTSTGGENPTVTLHWGASAGSLTNTVSLGTKGTGAFYHNLTGLSPGATYYYRFSAMNSAGTAESAIIAFMTPTAQDDPPPSSDSGGCSPALPGSAASGEVALLAGLFALSRKRRTADGLKLLGLGRSGANTEPLL